ncbi:MAG: YeeE/YedE family protein [Desulfobacterium sp.]|nr:YeeE/YedE family protein [Desulfobacterium sp.]
MIETFFANGTLDTPAAFLTSLIIGILFGVALEQAGFGSSRRLSGIFYFRDMTVLKVMFTAVVVAMLGICYARAFGWVTMENLYSLHTFYGAQIVGGLIFGAGFVMAGWCPGTGAVGMASGKVDALVFLLGGAVGSILYNEVSPVLGWLTSADRGVVFAYDSLGVSRAVFVFSFTVIAVGCFWGAEYVERKGQGRGEHLGTPFLKAFSVILVVGAFGLLAVPEAPLVASSGSSAVLQEAGVLTGLEAGSDHMEPWELADRLLAGDRSMVLVDIRTPGEFAKFHIRSALNIAVTALPDLLAPHKNNGLIVLYSNGMTHPAQVRDSLFRLGFGNVCFLTDGLKGFLDACLKPVSLRAEPVSPVLAVKINAWRAFFLAPVLAGETTAAAAATVPDLGSLTLPGMVETQWLNMNMGTPGVKIVDLRPQAEYNAGHIPGSMSLNLESLRGLVNGLPSTLLPAVMLAEHFSMMGVRPTDLVVLVCTDKRQDGTLVGMACERLRHGNYALLRGGFSKWVAEKHALDTILPSIEPFQYPVPDRPETFTVTAKEVLAAMGRPGTVILDVRPGDYFTGKKQDEARGGHIPGAINRPFNEDVTKTDTYTEIKSVDALESAYGKLIPTKKTPLIVHCRTGHQASQTFFILVRLLGYTDVSWYDAGWTEWAARPEFPVAKP